ERRIEAAPVCRGIRILIDLVIGDDDQDRHEYSKTRRTSFRRHRKSNSKQRQHQHHHDFNHSEVEISLGGNLLRPCGRFPTKAETPQFIEVKLIGLARCPASELTDDWQADRQVIGVERQGSWSEES